MTGQGGTMTKKEENAITKSYLRQVAALTLRIARLEAEIQRQRSERTYLSAIRYDGDTVQTSSSGMSPAMRQAERITDTEVRLGRLVRRRMQVREKIIRQIDQLGEPVAEEILARRYVDGWSFDEIAEEMSYSYDYVLHKHGEALSLFFAAYLSRK